MQEILNRVIKTHTLTKSEIISLLNSKAKQICEAADFVREKYVGNEIHLRALIEFSNFCKRNCQYCGIRYDNKKCTRYRLSKEEIISTAKSAIDFGYRTIVLQSGEDNYFSAPLLAEIIKEIKSLSPTPAITLSIGERTYEEYEALKKSGADRFLLRIETTDKNLYEQMHPNMNYENRIQCLKNLKKLGYEVGTGCLVGLPNQTIESLADDILFFKETDADMIGIGPLIIHPDTPLNKYNNGNFELTLKVMAITRLLLPDINIPATTAMETLNENGRIIALQSGANVIMPNFTSEKYKKEYNLYPGKILIDYNNLDKILANINRTISTKTGFRNKKEY